MDKNAVKRKIKQRKDAIAHCSGGEEGFVNILWKFSETLDDFPKSNSAVCLSHNLEMLEDAESAYKANVQYSVCTVNMKRDGKSRLKLFFKKVFRKFGKLFFGWLIQPILHRQTECNKYLLSISKALIRTCEQQNYLIQELYCRTDIINSTYKNELERLSSEVSQLENYSVLLNDLEKRVKQVNK